MKNNYHGGVWKVGYYDSTTKVFIGTIDNKVLTVILDAKPNYIKNLKVVRP